MIVLSFDTSSEIGGIAIVGSTRDIVHLRLSDTNRIAESIYSLVDRLLSSARLRINDIDFFSVVLGPGSFTGLRVSLAVAKAFSLSLNKPIYGIDTMRLMAFLARKVRDFYRVLVVQNARRDEFFISYFENDFYKQNDIKIVSLDQLWEILKRDNIPVVVREDEVMDFLPDGIDSIKVDKDLSVCCGELSLLLYNMGDIPVSAMEIEPIYVRNDVVRKKD